MFQSIPASSTEPPVWIVYVKARPLGLSLILLFVNLSSLVIDSGVALMA